MKQLYKITTSVKIWALSISSSTAVLRGIECEIVVLVMFEFKLKKMSHRAITCVLGRASSDTGSVRKFPFELFSDIIYQNSSHESWKEAKQCSQEPNYSISHGYMFCATKRSTGHTIKCGRSRDIHSSPTRNVAEHLCASYKLFDFIQRLYCRHICSGKWLLFFDRISKTYKWKPLTMRFVGIVVSGLVSGSYYDGAGESIIDALKTSKSTWHSVRTSRRTHSASNLVHVLQNREYVSGCLLWERE